MLSLIDSIYFNLNPNANSYLRENTIALSVYTAIVVDTAISKVSQKLLKL